MKQIVDIKDKEMISQVLEDAQYGTLALCSDNKPYSLPINFVEIDDEIYFHGGKKGRKIDILEKNKNASFSVVESYSMIQSYFSSKENSACPATHFFKSVVIDGVIEFVEDYEQKVNVLTKLMEKLQPEGKYKPLNQDSYQKMINVTCIYKLVPTNTDAKFKFGQKLTQERFDMILEHLEKRATSVDLATIDMMKEFRG